MFLEILRIPETESILNLMYWYWILSSVARS